MSWDYLFQVHGCVIALHECAFVAFFPPLLSYFRRSGGWVVGVGLMGIGLIEDSALCLINVDRTKEALLFNQ